MINNQKIILFTIILISALFSQTNVIDSRQTAITRAIKEAGSSVVSINVEQNAMTYYSSDPFFHHFFPYYSTQPRKSSGSGVIISPDGYLLTNTHVVQVRNITKITATLSGGKEYNLEIIGIDKTTDVALLKLVGDNFPYAKVGDSDDLIIGEWAIAIGNPLELFKYSNQPTASVGIISATHMDFGFQEDSDRIFQNMIQTDAAINPGNSGGPLVNSEGKVIGINTFIFTGSNYNRGSIGIGFAIPINTAMAIAKELKTYGSVDRSYTTGLEVMNLKRDYIWRFNIPFGEGVVVTRVHKNSPASKIGLLVDDIIVTAEDTRVNTAMDIRQVILENDLRSGDELKLKIYRDKEYFIAKLKLGSND